MAKNGQENTGQWEEAQPQDANAADSEVLFSQNPISGAIEAYTSEGQFIGTVETTGDFLEPPKPVPKEWLLPNGEIDWTDVLLYEAMQEEQEENKTPD